MSQLPDTDMSFAPLGAEAMMQNAMQEQAFTSVIDDALAQVRNPQPMISSFPSAYDEKLRQLIDAVPVE